MTKARDIADFKFENIVDTGTEGTRVATGTTVQRGSTAGQLRFNSDTGLAEYYTGTAFKIIDTPPTITSISPTEVASLDVGNVSFTITGTNFSNGAIITFIANDETSFNASSVTVNSGTSITAVAPNSSFSNSKEPYDIQIINTSNLSGILTDQIYIDNTVAWNTASGNIASILTNSTGTHATVSATDPDSDTITYSETGGTVLSTAGLTLNSATGAISGTPNSAGTLNFTLRATANGKTADRAFSITVTQAILTDFLIVAGGGSGGVHNAGGGGAGGLRTSYGSNSGGGSSAETNLGLTSGTTYTITVGAGGSAVTTDATAGNSGSNSSISGSGLTTITSIGGGGGCASEGSNPGLSGGSGGGGSSSVSAGSGTANQGFDGGTGSSSSNTGGGGGAGAIGQGGVGGSNGGAGGSGLQVNIDGNNYYWSGGGGGCAYGFPAGSGGTGGGGGGSGGNNGPGGSGGGSALNSGSSGGSSSSGGESAGNGGTNTGSGGGGKSRPPSGSSGAGGSGIVILRLPTADYTATYTGSPSVSTSGTDTILTFTGSGSYTA